MPDPRDDGGNAFPAQPVFKLPDGVQMVVDQGGMSLRDYFAGQALAGMVAVYWNKTFEDLRDNDYADAAYALADAMIEARKR